MRRVYIFIAIVLLLLSGILLYNLASKDSKPSVRSVPKAIANSCDTLCRDVKVADSSTDSIINNKDVSFYEKCRGSYYDNDLYAVVDGCEFKVDTPQDMCLLICDQRDFDNDGDTDALITNLQGYGGNVIGNSFFFVRYIGDGCFSTSEEFGNNVWDDPQIELWNGKPSVVIHEVNGGFDRGEHIDMLERYIFKDGKPIKVETIKKSHLATVKEIKSSDFHNGKEQETITLTYDLDENGVEDIIECTYWDRWNALNITIKVNGVEFKCNQGYYRIGVSKDKTNGVHDLICGDNDIIRWSGKEYSFN